MDKFQRHMSILTLDDFRVSQHPRIYAIGQADDLVTIHSQQARAIALAHLLTANVKSNNRKKFTSLVEGLLD